MYKYRKTKLVYGVGINDADYAIKTMAREKKRVCQFYRVWENMLRRCYSSKFHDYRPTYIGCTTASEWLYFTAFRAWMLEQDWVNKQLDKDIINPQNKFYSPETCVFVTPQVNKLLATSAASRGRYPIGVVKHRNSFRAVLSLGDGVMLRLGGFSTPQAASNAYNAAKAKYIRSVAKKQTDQRVVAGLLRHADLYKQGLVT